MTAPAVIRVKLDTTDAKRTLAELMAMGGKGVRVPATVPGGGGGGGGGGYSPGGGGGAAPMGGGGLDMSRLLGFITSTIAAQQMIGAAGPAALSIGRDSLRESLLGGAAFGTARGALAARDAVAGRFGYAYQQGMVNDQMLRQQYAMEMQYGAGAEAQGTARARAALGGEVLGTIGAGGMSALMTQGVSAIEALADAAKALKGALSGGP